MTIVDSSPDKLSLAEIIGILLDTVNCDSEKKTRSSIEEEEAFKEDSEKKEEKMEEGKNGDKVIVGTISKEDIFKYLTGF